MTCKLAQEMAGGHSITVRKYITKSPAIAEELRRQNKDPSGAIA